MATIAYLRVSTDDQDLGIEAQRKAIKTKYSPTAVFTDEGVSGARADREGLREALNALNSGDELVVAKRDRLGRDPMLMGWIELEVKKRGARVISIAGEGTENDDPTSILMRDIIDAFARFERLQIGARTKAALAVKKTNGLLVGEVPYGFNVDASGHLHHNEDEQEALSIIKELRSRGWTLRAICDELEDRGVRTKKGKANWQPKTVARLAKAA